MKITIEPEEGETYDKYVWENVYQVSMTANFMAQKTIHSRICHNVIIDKPELIGQLFEQIERVRGHNPK